MAKYSYYLWLGLCLSFAAKGAYSNWDFSPNLVLAESFTDNRALAPPGSEESDYISQVAPGFSLAGKGRNFLMEIDYQLQSVRFASESADNSIYHRLNVDINKNLIGEWSLFSLRASETQSVIDPRNGVPASNLVVTNNRTNVSTVEFGPVVRWKPKSYMLSKLSMQRGIVQYHDVDGIDVGRWHGHAEIDASHYPGRIGWGLRYDYVNSQLHSGRQVIFRKVDGDIHVRMASRSTLVAGLGYEGNDFGVPTSSETEGRMWRVGLVWKPRRRTEMQAFLGGRYFGRTAQYSFTNSGRHMSVEINYLRDIEAPNEDRFNSQSDTGQFNSITPGTLSETSSTDVAYVRRTSILLTRLQEKTNWSYKFYKTTRKQQLNLVRESVTGSQLGWMWQISSRRDFNVSGILERYYFSDMKSTDRRRAVVMSFSHRLGRHWSLSAEYEKNSWRSQDLLPRYFSNMFTLQVKGDM